MRKIHIVPLAVLAAAMTAVTVHAQQPALATDQSFAASLGAISVEAVKEFKPYSHPAVTPPKPAVVRVQGQEEVSGGGTVSGFGNFFCTSSGRVAGFISGGVMLSGTVEVSGPGGIYGSIPVSGNILMSGQCLYGSGNVSGMGTVSGSGTVYKPDGNPAGTAQVSGTIMANAFVSSSMASVTQYVSVSGTFQ